MRKTLLVLALTFGLVGPLAGPAHAVEGLYGESGCVGPPGGGGSDCYNVAGMAADMYVEDHDTLGLACGSVHVESIYVGSGNRYIEFGWYQEKSAWPACDAQPVKMFVAHETPTSGGQIVDYTGNLIFIPENYRFLMYRYSLSSSAFKFQYDHPIYGQLTVPVEVTMGALTGFGRTSTEIGSPNDHPGKYHKNVWTRSGDLTWYPANGNRNLICYTSGMANWKAVRTPGSGSIGDRLDYSSGSQVCFS